MGAYWCTSVLPSLRAFCFFCPSSFWQNFTSKISPQPCKLEWSYLVCSLKKTFRILGLTTSILLLIFPYICPIIFLSKLFSILWIMLFFIKELFALTVLGRIIIFGIQVYNDLLYYGIENQSSLAISSNYLYNFLSFHSLNNAVFHQRVLCNYAS